MIIYVKVDKLIGKRPVAVRDMDTTGKPEYCFGLNVWRHSVKRAWVDFQQAQLEENSSSPRNHSMQ